MPNFKTKLKVRISTHMFTVKFKLKVRIFKINMDGYKRC